jgi:hypothetical protein
MVNIQKTFLRFKKEQSCTFTRVIKPTLMGVPHLSRPGSNWSAPLDFLLSIASKAFKTYCSVNSMKEKFWLSIVWSFSIQPNIIVNSVRSYFKEKASLNKMVIKCINDYMFFCNEASVWMNVLWQGGGSRTLQGFDSCPEFSGVPITIQKSGYIQTSDLSYTMIP